LNWLASVRGDGSRAHLRDGGDEDGGRDITGVTASLTTLGADNVCADVDALLHVFRVPDHVHVEDAGFVELVDDFFGWDANGGDKEFGARFDDDVDEFGKFAFGVVVICLSGAAADLGDEQIDTEWGVLVVKMTSVLLLVPGACQVCTQRLQ
jgi:hypothetical protein